MAANPNQKQDAGGNGEKSFEASLDDLEAIVSQLEAGDKPLDDSLALYEKGVAALKRCHVVLDKAEKRIRMLVKNAAGEPVLSEGEMPRQSGSKRARIIETQEPAANDDEAEGSKNSGQQSVDSAPGPSQNVAPSVNSKPQAHAKPAAGGSLFGNPE